MVFRRRFRRRFVRYFKRRYKRRYARRRRPYTRRRRFASMVQRQTRTASVVSASIDGGEYADVSELQVSDDTLGRIYYLRFQMSTLPDVSDFTNLYDSFRIVGVRVVLYPAANTNEINNVTLTDVPGYVMTAIDYNETALGTNLGDILQYSTLKTHPWNRIIKRYFRPMISQPVFNGVDVSSFGSSKGPWLSTTDTTIPHFGLFVAFPSASANAIQKFRITVKYYLAFKNVR